MISARRGSRWLWLVLWVVLWSSGTVWGEERDRTLILGMVSDNPAAAATTLRPLVDHVAARMGDVGIGAGGIFIAPNKNEMVAAIAQNKVDWVTDTPFPILHFMERTGAQPLALRWKSGVGEYHTVFVAHGERPVDRLGDLVGRRIVFQDEDSSSAYFVPKAILKRQGFALVELSSPRLPVPDGGIGYVFGREDYFNQVAWLQRGIVRAAAMSNLDWVAIPEEVRRELIIFHRSPPFPRALEIVRPGLDGRIRERLLELLLAIHEDPAAAAPLAAYNGTTRFMPITAAVEEGMAFVRQVMADYQRE